MSIPTTISPVKKSDFTLTPIKVHKKFSFDSSSFETTGSGYTLVEGLHYKNITPIYTYSALNDPINLVDNSFKHTIWKHIDHLYYRDPYNPFATFEHWNPRYTYKFLNYSASILSIPYMDYGEAIKKQSVRITNNDSGITLIDDENGNLYDQALNQSIVGFNRYNTIGYWGFNELFREFRYAYGTIESGKYYYKSYTFSPDNYPSLISNVEFQSGPEINSTGSGISARFNGDGGYILTPNHDHFNFDATEEFSISFWVNPADTGSGALITKNGVEWQQTKGKQDKVLDSGQVTKDVYISSSYVDNLVNYYPFDFTYNSGSLTFNRSDGIRTTTLTGSISTGSWNHVLLTREISGSGYYMKMYVNSTASGEQKDEIIQPMNNHAMMFGARNKAGSESFNGNLDEIRFLNRAITSSIGYADVNNLYVTSTVGNVFYRQGNIVVSSLYPKYRDMFSGSWNIEYRGTHTIYQYEVLCRIKKGDFNLTLNPSARKSPKSDMLIDDFTGSLLMPYATTIGLYNDKGDLVAVSKMAQPIKMRSDVDINILIRFDI